MIAMSVFMCFLLTRNLTNSPASWKAACENGAVLKRLLREVWPAAAAEPQAGKKAATYRASYFDAADMEAAKRIILTPDSAATTEERWARETPYVVAEIERALALDENAVVIDYGCGIGRVAKGLIEQTGCSVIGVDISSNMRELAVGYVDSERFTTASPEALDARVAAGFRATHAYSCWVLQHCAQPQSDIERIYAALASGGMLFVLNSRYRCVPTDRGWVDDGISIEDLLAARFEPLTRAEMAEEYTTPAIAACAYLATFRKRG